MDIKINFLDYEQLGQTREFIFGKKKVEIDVVKIPIEKLAYNKKNGRIFLGVNEKEKLGIDFSSMSLEEFNNEIEDIIWNYDEDKNKSTLESIKAHGQLEICLISDEGIIIDGNRRFTCLRRLHRDFPEDNSFKYLKTCVLDQNIKEINNIDNKDIKRFELNVQFGKEEKADYHVIDRVMSIYSEVKSNNLSIDEIAEDMNISKNVIDQTCRTAELIEDFLDHFKIYQKYFVVDKLDLVNPFIELANFLKSTNVKDLTDTERNKRKNIFYELALSSNFDLPTQSLRNGLIKNIYKNADTQLTKDFITEYEDTIAQDIFSSIQEIDFDDPKQARNDFNNLESVKDLNKLFIKYKEKGGLKRTIEEQLDLAEKAKNSLLEIDLRLFDAVVADDNANSTYIKIQNTLKDAKKILESLIDES
jgi:predicted DNA-binding protein YlxM (UPF0122 family)